MSEVVVNRRHPLGRSHYPLPLFDAGAHAYTDPRNGRRLGGVTSEIDAAGFGLTLDEIPLATLEAARARGSYVHDCLAAHFEGDLDEAALDPAFAGYVRSALGFLAARDVKPIASELALMHPTYGYAGTLDLVAFVAAGKVLVKRAVIDWTTGATVDGKDMQVAAYAAAWDANYPAAPVSAGVVIALAADGSSPRVHEVNLSAAFADFTAVLRLNARRSNGGHGQWTP